MKTKESPYDHLIPTSFEKIEDALLRASNKAGIPVVKEGMVAVSQGGITFVAATIEGVAEIPTPALNEGVDFGFVYYAAPGKSIPTGFHTLRLRARVEEVGQVDAAAELVDYSGNVVACAEGRAEISSLRVLDDSRAIPMIMAQVAFDREIEPGLESRAHLQLGVWCKKNGCHGDGFSFQALP